MDPILFWNEVALEVHRRDFAFDKDASDNEISPQQGGPTRTARALAIVHVAMYDAWNGAKATGKHYLPIAALPTAPTGTSAAVLAAAAVAGAAASSLKALFNRQSAYIDQRMAGFVASALPAGAIAADISSGEQYGRAVAYAILDARKNDHADASDVYAPGGAPGDHRPDPYHPTQGYLGPRWGSVTPFCVSFGAMDTEEYLPPPPAFGSVEYRNHFEEVRDHGARTRGARSAEQEVTGLYWAYDGAKGLGTPPRLYNQIVRVIATAQGNDADQNARLFALVNAGMADAGIVAWRAKYRYNLWRPVVGIREDDAGTGPSSLGTGAPSAGDPFWEPYGAPSSNRPGTNNFTPNFPAYPSGHATFGTTVFEIVRRFFAPTPVTFEFTSDELDGKTVDIDGSVRTAIKRTYTLDEAIQDNLESRVWLGVHWRFDGNGGRQAGEKVAEKVFQGFFP